MGNRIKRKDLSRFALVWIVIIASVLVLWIVGLVFVRALLTEYEAVQPIHAAEQVFQEYFAEGSTDELLGYCNLKVSPYETTADAVGYYKSAIAGKEYTFKEVISADPEETMYAVSAGDVTFASFSLKAGDRTTEILGLHFPELSGMEVSLKPLCGAVIYAPATAEVRVNGILLDSSAMEGEPVILDEEPYFPSGAIDARTMVNYAVSGLYSDPTVTVKEAGADGRELKLEKEESVFSAELAYRTMLADEYNAKIRAEEERKAAEEEARRQEEERKEAERQRISDEIKAEYGAFVRSMSEQFNKLLYAKTTTALRNETKVFFKPGTEIYTFVTSTHYNYGAAYKTIEFTDVSITDFEWLDEAHTKFKCHAQMIVKMYGYDPNGEKWKDYEEVFDRIPYVEISNNKTLVYDMPTAAADAAAEEDAQNATEETQ